MSLCSMKEFVMVSTVGIIKRNANRAQTMTTMTFPAVCFFLR